MPIENVKQNSVLIEKIELFLQAGYSANEEFNSAFSGEEAVIIRSRKDSNNEYKYDASEILYWVDRQLYLDELDSWSDEFLQNRHSLAIDFLKSSDQIPVFLDLIELIRRHKITPFLGAGVSKAANYPLWGEALKTLSNKITNINPQDISCLLEEDKFLEAAQKIADASEHQLKNYIATRFRTIYDSDEDREKIPPLFKLLPRLSSGCIVTTNFDCLIEETFKIKGTPLIDGYMHGIQQGNNFIQSLLKGNRCILKLHGDASQSQTYVFTEKEYKNAYGDPINFSNQLPKALRQIYISNSLLFVGCSLAQDKTLELFKEVKDSEQFAIPDHFAIISYPENEEKKQIIEDRLFAINIRPIWYETEKYHQMVTKLIELAVDIADRRVNLGVKK
ncbi:MAG: hypothetical protein COB67_13235 [SAR324 cluster bacterium]|uniref:Uncharacterized protein n=1 Tax=SAR324 cluster bacterium TaxID=2024889 RepID=A0A2A4SNT4_9DELT|nr:MAG: hypothetical protein COB67_13235 [SAR324 cluster bacterium]